jgi:hypothetical protein
LVGRPAEAPWARRLAVALLGLVSLGVAGFVYLGALARAADPVFVIEHTAEIDAPPERVWRVLTDLEAYPDWNPYVLEITGGQALGDTLTLTILQRNWDGPLTLFPVLSRREAPRTWGWHGSVGVPGLHETEHYFVLEPLSGGRTRLVQREEFRGWLPGWMNSEDHRAPTREAFRAMNLALAARVEAQEGPSATANGSATSAPVAPTL